MREWARESKQGRVRVLKVAGKAFTRQIEHASLLPHNACWPFKAVTSALVQMKEAFFFFYRIFVTGTPSWPRASGGEGKIMASDMLWTWQNAQQEERPACYLSLSPYWDPSEESFFPESFSGCISVTSIMCSVVFSSCLTCVLITL